MNSGNNSSGTFSTFDEKLEQHGVHLENGDQLCWNENAHGHPRHWSAWTKTFSVVVICWLELFMTGISSAGVRSIVFTTLLVVGDSLT